MCLFLPIIFSVLLSVALWSDYKCNGGNGEKNGTTSVPKSVPCLELDKIRLKLVSGIQLLYL